MIKPPRRVFEFPEDKPDLPDVPDTTPVDRKPLPEVLAPTTSPPPPFRESSLEGVVRRIRASGGLAAGELAIDPSLVRRSGFSYAVRQDSRSVAYLFVHVVFVDSANSDVKVPSIRTARIMSDSSPTLLNGHEQWLKVDEARGNDYQEAQDTLLRLMRQERHPAHAWLPFLNRPVPEIVPRPAPIPLPTNNLERGVIRVAHAELRRIDESPFKSQCPECADGVLHCTRDPEDLMLLRTDRCIRCGQLFFYTDAAINGESLLRIRLRSNPYA